MSIFEDNSGGISSARVLMMIWGVGVFGMWAFASIKSGTLVTIPTEVITILLGLSAAKTVQRFGEKDSVSPDSSDKKCI